MWRRTGVDRFHPIGWMRYELFIYNKNTVTCVNPFSLLHKNWNDKETQAELLWSISKFHWITSTQFTLKYYPAQPPPPPPSALPSSLWNIHVLYPGHLVGWILFLLWSETYCVGVQDLFIIHEMWHHQRASGLVPFQWFEGTNGLIVDPCTSLGGNFRQSRRVPS